MKEIIDKVGIELEGGWRRLFWDAEFIDEASVDRPEGYTAKREHWGELVQKVPLPMEESIKWMIAHYPDDVPPPSVASGRENSCGLHIHASVKTPAMYASLMRKAFHNYFLEQTAEWAKRSLLDDDEFWPRWNGENRFCRREHRALQQAKYKDKGHNRQDRRTQLNYPWKYLHTIECRMFPMFRDPRLGEAAVRLYCRIIEEWVRSNGSPAVKKGRVLIPRTPSVPTVRNVRVR